MHDFNFNGGDILRHIAAGWFVSYAYHEYVNKNHLNWSRAQSSAVRKTKYFMSRDYHKEWLNEVLHMNNSKLNTNKLDLTANQIKEMAAEVLKVI